MGEKKLFLAGSTLDLLRPAVIGQDAQVERKMTL